MAVRLVVVGGFLGAGKTSILARTAAELMHRGLRVGVVTNDQSDNLVDTHFLQSQGFPVVEVTRGCFCCNFDEFALKLKTLSERDMPDIILAEPVGSCTDLVATIFKPVMNRYTKEFIMSPLTVIADPRRVRRYRALNDGGITNEINYLFDRQLSEADLIVLNKCDQLSPSEVSELCMYIQTSYPQAQVYPVSALTGEGMQTWLDAAVRTDARDKASYTIDYDIYARAEALLGWYNGFCTVTFPHKADMNGFTEQVLESIRAVCLQNHIDIAHLKAFAVTGTCFAKASVTSAEDPVFFNAKAELPSERFNLILNARMQCSPETLASLCGGALREAAHMAGALLDAYTEDFFAPSYPKPKYRME